MSVKEKEHCIGFGVAGGLSWALITLLLQRYPLSSYLLHCTVTFFWTVDHVYTSSSHAGKCTKICTEHIFTYILCTLYFYILYPKSFSRAPDHLNAPGVFPNRMDSPSPGLPFAYDGLVKVYQNGPSIKF